jgi:hypothetical protein
MDRLKRASSFASLAALIGLVGCEEARSPSREPLAPPEASATAPTSAAAPAPPLDTARARLERIIVAGGLGQFRDGCLASAVWAQVDAPDAGKRLDTLVDTYAATPTPSLSARDSVACYPSAINGRLIRRWRTGELDLDAELRHPNAKVRAATIVLLAHAHARPEAIRAALGDPSFDVRMKAFTAVGDAKDHAAEPQLEAIIAKIPASAPAPAALDRRWACSTLAALRGTSPCPDVTTGGAGGLLTHSSSGPARDRCEEQRASLASAEPATLTRGLFALLHARSGPLTRPFDPLLHDAAPLADCGTTDAQLESLLDHRDAAVSSLAAATLLATHHLPLPTTPAALSPRR